MHVLGQSCKVARAIAPIVALGSGGNPTAIEVDATGFDRAMFILYHGTQAGADKNGWTELEVQEAGTSGGTYAAVAATQTSIGSTASNQIAVIDMAVAYNKPYLKLTGTTGTHGTSALTECAVCVLYRGTRVLPSAQEIAAVVC
jgi:hypothetical protein